MQSAARIKAAHFGSDYYGAHVKTDAFDFYCVAHGGDYSPAYMGGIVCHDQMGEPLCADECRICPQPCPIKPCPLPDEEVR